MFSLTVLVTNDTALLHGLGLRSDTSPSCSEGRFLLPYGLEKFLLGIP